MADRSAKLDFIMRLTDQVTAPLAKVKMGFSQLAEQSEKYIKQAGIGLAGMVGAGVAISKAMEPALEQNRALGEVKSLGVAEDALDALNRKSLAFSIAYGANARDFVASAYSIEGAIKGLTGSQLATFTNASNVLAKATKSDADTMGAYVGTMYNLFKGQADAMGKGAWVERLGGQTALAVQLFRTSGAQIGDAFKAAGGLASTAGVDLAEQMAVLGTLSSTMEGGEAGGLYKAFFENVTGASEKLGMSFTDQQGRLLPMMGILEKLQKRFGDLSIEANGKALRDAFGGEAARLISTLMNDTGRLANGMDQLGRVRGLEQAQKMAQDMVDPWQQFGAAVQALRVSFGQVLIPLLAPLMQRLTDITATFSRWTGMFPNLARVIGILVLGTMGLVAAVSAVTMVVGISKLAWLGLNVVAWKSIGLFLYHSALAGLFIARLMLMATWMGIVKTASLLWQGALWLVNAALLANPIVWVVLAIVALGAALVAAVVYWDEIVAAITNTEAFKWVSTQLAALSAWFDSMGGWGGMAKAAWDGITSIFYKAINGLISMLNKIPGVNIETTFGDMPAPPDLPELVTSPPGQGAAAAVQRAQPAGLVTAPAGIPAMVQPASLQLPQPILQTPSPLVLPQPSVQAPAPLALAQPRVQPQILPPAPLALPQPSIQTPAPLALPQPSIQTPAPLALVQPQILPPAPLALPQPSIQTPAPLALPQPSIQTPAPLALVQPQILPPGPIALPQPADIQLPAAQVAIASQEASEKGQRARQAINDSLPSVSPRTATAVPQGGLLRQIQNTQTVNRGAHVEKVEIHTGKAMSPLELENMIQMATG